MTWNVSNTLFPVTVSEELQRTSHQGLKLPSLDENLADSMHALRKKRRIAGAHRLAGISVVPNQGVLGIRMDICVRGRYVHRYYLFFNESRKLVQHTLPKGVPVGEYLSKHVDDMAGLRRCIGDIYDACYCHAVRQDASDYLKTVDTVTGIECSKAFDLIAFRMNDMRVRLKYMDPFSALPTSAEISRVREMSAARTGDLVVSDEEDDDSLDLAKRAFLTCGVRTAMNTITNT